MKTLENKANSTKLAISIIVSLFFFTNVVAQTGQPGFNFKDLFPSEVTRDVYFFEETVIAEVEVDLYKKSLDFVIEKPVKVEDWMLNPDSWNNKPTEEKEGKGPLPEVESWRIHISGFNAIIEKEQKVMNQI